MLDNKIPNNPECWVEFNNKYRIQSWDGVIYAIFDETDWIVGYGHTVQELLERFLHNEEVVVTNTGVGTISWFGPLTE